MSLFYEIKKQMKKAGKDYINNAFGITSGCQVQLEAHENKINQKRQHMLFLRQYLLYEGLNNTPDRHSSKNKIYKLGIMYGPILLNIQFKKLKRLYI